MSENKEDIDEFEAGLNDPVILQEQLRNKIIEEKYKLDTELKVGINNIEYDANNKGQLNMSSVCSLANWQFNVEMLKDLKAIENPSGELQQFIGIFEKNYKKIYQHQRITWRDAENTNRNISISSIFKALLKALMIKESFIKKL